MNPETKEFEPIEHGMSNDDPRSQWPTFGINQEFIINGVKFRIKEITKHDLILRPVNEPQAVKFKTLSEQGCHNE